jgi:nucleoside-diphosphate-sugar epimerase
VTINQLVEMVSAIAGITVTSRHDLSAPQGVRGRNSDNALIRDRLGWQPEINLLRGLETTYRWIHDRLASRVLV